MRSKDNRTRTSLSHVEESMLSGEKRVSAWAMQRIVAANDSMALGAMRMLRKHGVAGPKGVRVAGFDDVLSARVAAPSLSTVIPSTPRCENKPVQRSRREPSTAVSSSKLSSVSEQSGSNCRKRLPLRNGSSAPSFPTDRAFAASK